MFRLTLQKAVELVNTRCDTKVNALLAKVDNDTAKNRRVDLFDK